MADQENKRALLASTLGRLSDATEKRRETAKTLDEYDKQRLALANEADAMLRENRELGTDKDHFELAHAFDSTGEQKKARRHWEQCVQKSIDQARAENLQWFGRFLLLPPQNERKAGREKTRKELQGYFNNLKHWKKP